MFRHDCRWHEGIVRHGGCCCYILFWSFDRKALTRKVIEGHQSDIFQDNWCIAPTRAVILPGNFINAIYGSSRALLEHRFFADVKVEDIKAKFVRVQYEIFCRHSRTEYLLFTIKTMMPDPMYELSSVYHVNSEPRPQVWTRKGAAVGPADSWHVTAMLSYLDSIKK